MSQFSLTVTLAIWLTSTATGLAEANGSNDLNRTDAIRRQTTEQASFVRVDPKRNSANNGALRRQGAPDRTIKSAPHRYNGGPKSIH
jgi:hypothetical protein